MAREQCETDRRGGHDIKVHLVESVAGTVYSGLGEHGVGPVIALTVAGELNADGSAYTHTYVLDVDDVALMLTMLQTGGVVLYGQKALDAAIEHVRHELEVSGLLDPDSQAAVEDGRPT